MSDAKFTKCEWIADIMVGCCAVYASESLDDWEQGLHDDDRNIFYQSYPNVATNPELSDESIEPIANAHLIAAAPEMYQMLKMIMDILNSDDHENEVSNADIAKLLARARGEHD